MESYLRVIFSRSIPAYFWLAVAYVVFVIVVKFTMGAETDPGLDPTIDEGQRLSELVETALQKEVFPIPLFTGQLFQVTWMMVFVTLGFISAWVEVLRALQIRNTGRNDTWSVIVTLAAFMLFVGFSAFGTSAFLIVALVGFGDVILDRQVGQAVARRDFGGLGDG